MCNSSFFESNIFATIVGGAIGFFSSIFVSIWYSGHHDKVLRYNNYKGWCNGVRAEINHLIKVIDEISSILKENVPSTKRLNHDYLEQARIRIVDFESDISFIESLTNAYRDVVHTNEMLNRLESNFEKSPNSIANVKASMDGVKNSIQALNTKLDVKIKEIKKPPFFVF
jgi:hypothetical protein